MSLYQCEECGCLENTACGHYWCANKPDLFDWSDMRERRGKKLCAACAPSKFRDGTSTERGAWHKRFERIMLPKGQFKTNRDGNLEHIETGDTNVRKYQLNKDSEDA